MRQLFLLTICCVCSTPALAAAANGKAKVTPSVTAAEAMIRDAFNAADRNKNGVLSQVEFHRAQTNLQAGILELARTGQLKTGSKNGKQPPNGAAVFGVPLVDVNKSNQISMTDFAAYAQRIVNDAIAANAASTNKSKSANRSRPYNRNRAGYRRSPQRNIPAIVVAKPGKEPARQNATGKPGKTAQAAKATPKKK